MSYMTEYNSIGLYLGGRASFQEDFTFRRFFFGGRLVFRGREGYFWGGGSGGVAWDNFYNFTANMDATHIFFR